MFLPVFLHLSFIPNHCIVFILKFLLSAGSSLLSSLNHFQKLLFPLKLFLIFSALSYINYFLLFDYVPLLSTVSFSTCRHFHLCINCSLICTVFINFFHVIIPIGILLHTSQYFNSIHFFILTLSNSSNCLVLCLCSLPFH